MQSKRQSVFATIRTEGGILPVDLLARILEADSSIEGLTPADYHLIPGVKLHEEISRSWSRLLGAWRNFRISSASLPESDRGTSITRERWLLVLFSELGYGRLMAEKKACEIEGKAYPVSHFWQNVPIHLLGFRIDMDHRYQESTGVKQAGPHSMMQEFLNRSCDHLWGIVSNGLCLRILRNSVSLSRQSFLEFDLESMMEQEVYSDFALLWMICHESRLEAQDKHDCFLEKWSKLAQRHGTRALDQLRTGVEKAILALGQGFLSYPRNQSLKEALRSGNLPCSDYYHQLLRMVYRLLFLFVAEDRGMLLHPQATQTAKNIYSEYYSTARLRRLAESHKGTHHIDLWRCLALVMEKFYEQGCPELGLSPLDSILWSPKSISGLKGCDISNRWLLSALRELIFITEKNVRRTVDYRNLGAEELGSIYESLLELHPEVNLDAGTFELKTALGHERKTTGSYYTPTPLILSLLDTALQPKIEEAIRKQDPENALLNLKVCDPSCGSGHFLIAASHRIARKVAEIRTQETEPSPVEIRKALRDVIGRCIYGVDINPMAVELCKVALWMESLEAGKPLSFLDHHIKCANSLLGATPKLLRDGIPEEAFQFLEGDDKKVCTEFKQINRNERKERNRYKSMHQEKFEWDIPDDKDELATEMKNLDKIDDSTIEGIRKRQDQYENTVHSSCYLFRKFWNDAWCAAFVWKKIKAEEHPYPLTEDIFRKIEQSPHHLTPGRKEEIQKLAKEYQFFHWHLEFPDVFSVQKEKSENEKTGWNGGFDVVLGNPPWERIKLQEKEWFAVRCPEVAQAMNASERGKKIKNLQNESPELYREFQADIRKAEGESHFIRHSQQYPLCGRGDVNTYSVFAEKVRMILSSQGRAGIIVPSGIATDDTTKLFFQELMESKTLVSLYDFENRAKLFPEVDSRMKFCLLTMSGLQAQSNQGGEFAFFAQRAEDIKDEEKKFTLSAQDIALINPNTKTCPIFRGKRDARLTQQIYRRVPVLIQEEPEKNPWGMKFLRMLDMASDSSLFRTREDLEKEGGKLSGNLFIQNDQKFLPLYEAKMLHHFDHRFGDYADLPAHSKSTQLPDVSMERLQDPKYQPLPRYWVQEAQVLKRIEGKWQHGWLMGWRDITNTTNERTVIASVLPRVGVGHTYPLMFFEDSIKISLVACLLSNLCCFMLDYTARQKIGGTHLTYNYLHQLPILPPEAYQNPCPWEKEQSLAQWILPRVLELTYTAWDLQPFAKDCGYDGPPFSWDEERRFGLRCELDAAYFHLYQIERGDVDYILETFPIVKKADEKAYGAYRTKDTILKIYDKMAELLTI